jgi:hypothetical protein
MDADIDAELTADLVSDYIFSNKDFINKLAGNKKTFRAVYNEIKYLCKVATGKELTQMEKVRQEFDKVWKELSDKGIDTVVENAKGNGKNLMAGDMRLQSYIKERNIQNEKHKSCYLNSFNACCGSCIVCSGLSY